MTGGFTLTIETLNTAAFGELPWLRALAASSVPRLADRSDADIMQAVEIAAIANSVSFWVHDDLPPGHWLIDDLEMGRDYLCWIKRPYIYVQTWERRSGRYRFERIDIAKRPGGYVPEGSVSA